jgi:multisubunit Na+/H+ antiporter MnhB subunit
LYALLLVCSIVALLIWRVTILLMIITLIGSSPANGSIYAVSLIAIGIGLFMLVIGAEPYLRNGVKRGQLMRRFVRVALPVVAVGMLGLLLGSWM